MKRIWATVLAFLLVVGVLASAQVLASILATFFGGMVTIVASDGTGTLRLYVNSNDTSRMNWAEIGMQPYLDAVDHPANLIAVDVKDALEGDFSFMDCGKSTETITGVTVQIYGTHASGKELEVFVWNSSSWTSLGAQALPSSWGSWVNYTATTVLNTWAKIDAAKIYLKTSATGTYNIDCARLQIEYNATI